MWTKIKWKVHYFELLELLKKHQNNSVRTMKILAEVLNKIWVFEIIQHDLINKNSF